MTIALCVFLWLLCGFIGCLGIFYFKFTGISFYDSDTMTTCQIVLRSLLGPANFYILLMICCIAGLGYLIQSVDLNKRCTKVLFRRK